MRMRSWTITTFSSALLTLSVSLSAQTTTPAAGSLRAAINTWAVQQLPPFSLLLSPDQLGKAVQAANAIEAIAGL